MKKGLSGFFKSSAFVRLFFVFGAAFFATLAISCRQLASFDPVVNGGDQTTGSGGSGGMSSEPTEFSFDLKATHGLKRKISLEWNSFSGASYYEIYFAESSSAEFIKIGEAQTNSFEDNVGAGRTGYFRVRAVKPNGASSPFSSTVVGTSLAMPIISGGEVDEFEATVTWSMENARGIDGTDYYESSLIFEVVCQSKDGVDSDSKVLPAVDFAGSSYSCKFEGLSSSRDYEFYVKAYLEGDAQNEEQSPTVDKTTLTAYTPLAPKFTASEGDSAKGISLLITLPEMVTVMTYLKDSENSKEMQDVLYPLFFEVYRKHENAEKYSTDPTRVLYYGKNGFTYSAVEYEEEGKPYEAGKQAIWFDDDPNLVGGEKYDYMIRSVVDANYSKVVCPEDKQYDGKTGTPESMATTARGWKSATPSFNVKFAADGGRKISNGKVVSVSFGFSAEWKDLGKAENYKFAIKQSRTPWNSDSSILGLLKNGQTYFFDTLSEIGSRTVTFGSESGGLGKDEQGSYSYTLYIVPKNEIVEVEDPEKIIGEIDGVMLDSMTALDRVVVTEEVSLPNAELAVRDGYNGKVILEVLNYEKGVTYSVERATLEDGKADEKSVVTIDLSAPGSGSFVYDDTDVQPNCSYSYVLKAVAMSGVFSLSTAQLAETLGTPSVTFLEQEYAYDSISISFDKVLGAKQYVLKLGEKGDFGGGVEYTFNAENPTSDGNAEISPEGNTYNVKIKTPEGYNDARFAGKVVKAVVTAKSSVDSAPSAGKNVNVVGPASLETRANTSAEAQDDSISVSWNKVEGAKGYLIKRVMYSDTAMKEVAEASDVVYYCDSSTNMVTLVDGSALGGRASVSNEGGKFTLIDTYKEKDTAADADLAIYQEAQSKIPWGLPFRYVVLPVLNKSDFDFTEATLALTDSGKVKYSNFAEKQTDGCATWGYGLNLVAEKAMSDTVQRINWEKPNTLKGSQKALYRRSYTAYNDRNNQFELVNVQQTNDVDATISIADDDIYDAFEYVVKYSKEGVTPSANIKLPESLFDELARQTEEPQYTPNGEIKEQKNKGYLLSINFKTVTHPNPESKFEYKYAEQISWTPWDYTIRAVGPEVMLLSIRNNNIDAIDHDVFSITVDKKTGMQNVELKTIDEHTDVEQDSATFFNIMSKDLVDGKSRAEGMLKVLRDGRHYYTLTLKHGEYEVAHKKYAYRQITNEELVRAATLAMAYGIQKTGTNWQTSLSGTTDYFYESYPGGGSAMSYRKGGTTIIVKLTHTFTFGSFSPVMPTLAGEGATFLTVNGSMTGTTDDGGSEGQQYAPRTYTNGSITVTAAESGIDLYKATIKISSLSANGSSGITVDYIADNGPTSFGDITPFTFGNGNKKYSKNPLNDGDSEWQ